MARQEKMRLGGGGQLGCVQGDRPFCKRGRLCVASTIPEKPLPPIDRMDSANVIAGLPQEGYTGLKHS